MGILRSGESQSEVFPELQIIDPETFELAQKLMAERVNEYNVQRTLPPEHQRTVDALRQCVLRPLRRQAHPDYQRNGSEKC
jgi:hypothetical protein